jgi:hypothetical protein
MEEKTHSFIDILDNHTIVKLCCIDSTKNLYITQRENTIPFYDAGDSTLSKETNPGESATVQRVQLFRTLCLAGHDVFFNGDDDPFG